MTHGALFNGIAGFPLAAQWAGIRTEWTVEIDEFCNKVSKKHFPHATQYTDIHEAKQLPYVDIISGGFPCQPFSVAGKQLGNEDDRALWPQMLRVIREVRPKYVIGENVAGIINMALDAVLSSLEAEGYATEAFIVPACGVGASHKRDRVWIIAYAIDRGSQDRRPESDSSLDRSDSKRGKTCYNLPAAEESGCGNGRPDFGLTESPLGSAANGLSSGLVRNRSKQIKAYGNAIVPQVAYEFFNVIQQIEGEAR